MQPLDAFRRERGVDARSVKLLAEPQVAIDEHAVNTVAIGLRQARAFFFRQCHEFDGFVAGAAGGFEMRRQRWR
jgi:hypothetical protein